MNGMVRTLDLVGRPWAECNCGQVAAEGLRRMDMADAAATVPVDPESAARLLATPGGPWAHAGSEACAAEPGDLVVSTGPLGWHVGLCLGAGYVLTSSLRHGVHLLPKGRVLNVTGIYRWSGGAE